MKTIPPLQLARALRLRGTFLAVLAGCLAASLAAAHAAQPSVQALLPGKWPLWPQVGGALAVTVVGNNAYVALAGAGLGAFDGFFRKVGV